MTSKSLQVVAIAGLFFSAAPLWGSDKDIQQFFQAARKGFYQVLLDNAKNRKMTPQEIMSARDANGNTLFGAALEGYKAAAAKYGQPKAAELVYNIVALLLSQLSKEDASKILTQTNKSGIPPLFTAAQLGLLKVAVLLHDKGALSVTKDGKKASNFSNNPQMKTILLQWENLEGDWALIEDKQ